jgi:hypothetical protein
VAGCDITTVSAGCAPGVVGVSATFRSGKNAAWAGAAVTRHRAATTPAMRASFIIGMFASAKDATG